MERFFLLLIVVVFIVFNIGIGWLNLEAGNVIVSALNFFASGFCAMSFVAFASKN